MLTASCAQQQIEFQSNGFNRAIEQTTNELLLLNIVRSSKDLPMYFTKLTGFTGGNMLSGTVAPKLPFGPGALASYDLGLSTSWSSGVSTMQFADLNQQEGLNGLRAPIEFYVFDRYAVEGSPWWVLSTLMFDGFEVSSQINDALLEHAHTECRKAKTPVRAPCNYLEDIKRICGSEWILAARAQMYQTRFGTFSIHINRGKNECEYLRFQSFLTVLAISGFVVDTLPMREKEAPKKKKSKDKASDEDTEATTKAKPKPYTEIRFAANPKADALLRQADKELVAYFTGKRPNVVPKLGVNPTMRSPKRMLEFLGELTAAQNYGDKTFIPSTLIAGTGGKRANFFTVRRGDKASKGAALVIRDPHGEIFSIPAPELGSPTRDQSLVVLAIVNDLVNAYTSKGAYPSQSVVEFRSIN